PEKVGLLLRPLHRSALRTTTHAILADGRLALGVIGLVAHRVPAGILAEIDIARLFHPPPDLGRRAVMALLGGADEITVRKSQQLGHLAKPRGVAVRELARRKPLPGGRLLHLQAMLV